MSNFQSERGMRGGKKGEAVILNLIQFFLLLGVSAPESPSTASNDIEASQTVNKCHLKRCYFWSENYREGKDERTLRDERRWDSFCWGMMTRISPCQLAMCCDKFTSIKQFVTSPDMPREV
jgi:hypothetical protein